MHKILLCTTHFTHSKRIYRSPLFVYQHAGLPTTVSYRNVLRNFTKKILIAGLIVAIRHSIVFTHAKTKSY